MSMMFHKSKLYQNQMLLRNFDIVVIYKDRFLYLRLSLIFSSFKVFNFQPFSLIIKKKHLKNKITVLHDP